MINKVDELFKELYKWEVGGVNKLSNHTVQICNVPHIAPKAWLHEIYAPLIEEKIIQLEELLGLEMPSVFKDFLSKANGINIFSDSLSIWGMRNSYVRTGDEAIQPFSIVDLNSERPMGCPDSWLFFGSYSWDGSTLFFDTALGREVNRVYRCENGETKVIQEWSSFWEWLLSEVHRLTRVFDSNGIEFDESQPTIPTIIS